jgi:predicted AlkP superfamily pyrophosphatase or phosphodiesterase
VSSPAGRVVVIDVVGLQTHHISQSRTPNLDAILGDYVDLRPPFPAVTVPSQTTLASGRSPAAHGDVANGRYDRRTDTVTFWGRDRGDRTRLWEAAHDVGLTTGALFFQHLLGTTADVAVTPSPIEDEDDNLIEMNCWTNPDGFYDLLREKYGHFPLHTYWGPGANADGSRWILDAARETVERYDPDLLWTYVPHLDYAGLAAGPGPELDAELDVVDDLLGEFFDALRSDDRWAETAVVVVSEYGFHQVGTPVFPNRALREADLLEVTDDGEGGEQVDLDASRAFAMVDHQVAHVFCDDVEATRAALSELDGVEEVLGEAGKAAAGIDHPDTGDLVLVADRNAWFQYYWWTDRDDAPFYATDVDIHKKPGFDPCELFFGREGMASIDPTKVGGSHGRVDEETHGILGVGGPSAPALPDRTVDARSVAPTVADLLGVVNDVDMSFERPSVVGE